MPAPSGIRLRESCEACAASKTKCSKDKPQCIRCAKRGTSCQYLVTQRTGRKARSPNDSKEERTQPPTLSRTTTPKSPVTLSSLSSLESESSPELSMLYSRLDALEAAMLSSRTTGSSSSTFPADLDFSSSAQPYDNAVDPPKVPPECILGIPLDSSGPHEISDTGYLWSLPAVSCVPDQQDLPFPSDQSTLCGQDLLDGEGNQAPFTDETTSSLPYQPLVQEIGNCQTHASSAQQDGLKMALQLLGDLCCLEYYSAYSNFQPLELEHWANTLLDQCKTVTGTVSQMLQCPGSEDGYFLAVVCLVMSKVLDAYFNASEALRTRGMDEQRRSLSSSSSTLSSWSANDSDSSPSSAAPTARDGDPKAAQQLLDELYQVRASMDLLGAKIASMSSQRDWVSSGHLNSPCQDTPAAALPFSAKILDRLYDKQHSRLRTISLQLIRDLKAFWANQY